MAEMPESQLLLLRHLRAGLLLPGTQRIDHEPLHGTRGGEHLQPPQQTGALSPPRHLGDTRYIRNIEG